MAIEERRICGLRHLHGLYLVGTYIPIDCDRLPLPIGVCKYCGQGLKFGRGFTLLNPQKLWGDHKKCGDKFRPCHICDPPNEAYLMFVGNEYKTPQEFLEEGLRLGISKKIPFIPKKLVLGKTIVYLAHSKAYETLETTEAQLTMDTEQARMVDTEKKVKKSLGIFCAFIPQRVEQLFHETEVTDKLKERLAKRGITPIIVPNENIDHKLC